MELEELRELQLKIQQQKLKNKDCSLLVEELENKAIDFLQISNEALRSIIKENKELLVNDQLFVNVYKDDSFAFGTHAIQLSGNIHHNGYMYLETDSTESRFSNMYASSRYATNFKGIVQWNGKVLMKATKRKFQFFGSRVPEQFQGFINENGDVEMTLIKSRFELFGDEFMSNLMTDPFNGDQAKRQKFNKNIARVKKIVSDFLQGELG
jgi:uncharacterized membrane protein